MSDVMSRLRKRRAYPVTVGDETVYIRATTRAERESIMQHQQAEVSFGLTLGFCLVDSDGTALFEKRDGEQVEQFGERVLSELDLPDDTRTEICSAIVKLSQGPSQAQIEALKKN